MMTKSALLVMIFSAIVLSTEWLIEFQKDSSLDDWYILDDGVMGGLSQGNFSLTNEGHLKYFGKISTANYGGFSSLRYMFNQKEIPQFNVCTLRIKGDGKKYQFRIKDDRDNYYSYITYFDTTKEWKDITINLTDMYPSFRGRVLNFPNYKPSTIEELCILAGNKKNESFEILVDWIKFH